MITRSDLIHSLAELPETVQNQILQLLSDSQCSGNINASFILCALKKSYCEKIV